VDLHISLTGRANLSRQIYEQIRAAIMDGLLSPGAAVPSTRELAQRLSVSRNSVSVAYDRLVAEGFLVSRVGAGSFVSTDIQPLPRIPRVGSPLRARAIWDEIREPPVWSEYHAQFDFRAGVPDARLFPFATWRALVADQLRPAAVQDGANIHAAGHPGLRAAIARHIGLSRAVRVNADDVFVTSGSQQAVDLVARVLLEPGDAVALEDPGYPPVQKAFASLGNRIIGVPVDAEGLIVDALPEDARLVFVTPSHQFPLGVTMSLRRRLALLEWAERVDAAILEDDYDSEFRYHGRPLEPLQSMDRTGRVLYVGSFSKVMLPTLRLGFLVAPAPLHAALRKAKHVTDWHTAVPLQAAAARFIEEGLLARHIRRMRNVYANRHSRLSAAVDRDLADHLTHIPSAAGLHIAVVARREDFDDVAVIRRARAADVALSPLSPFAVTGSPRPGLILGYGAIASELIDEGLRRVSASLDLKPASGL
jgi:GntR family transcriptional regulator/MocR family aminotransferase